MSWMGTSATTRNRTISRSGLDNEAISAGSRAQCRASTRRRLGRGQYVVAADTDSRGGTGNVPPRAAPPPGPAAVLIPPTPTPGCGCRPLDPIGPWPTGAGGATQAPNARHANPNTPHQLGDVGGTLA